ncbi:MAG: HAD-IA family hydrolase [Clostridia bacterium]|nr:HAD-IA family hydrolase [Clostridia bacterium]MBQ6805547.1 HAD-IA family hydrolase [Clostridia bacterium]
MRFSTIFFDIDYCLLDTPTSERRIIRELYARQGQEVGDEVGDEYREINKQLWVYLDRGEITRERLYVMRFEQLFKRHPFFQPAEEVAPWFLDQLAHAYDAQEGAEHLLKRLQENGVRVFTASNGIGEVMNGRVKNAGLSQYLTGKFAADEVGAMKPSPKYFDYIFKHSGETDLSRTLMIGDNPVTDVDGAVEYGMVGALFGLRWQEKSKASFAAPTMKELENWIFEE